MSIKIGITGGIGSGKTIVSKLLQVMGVPVYIADTEARRLTVADAGIREQLIAVLGKEIYTEKDELNKTLLAGYLFSSPDHAKVINRIIHPRVREDFRWWVQHMAAYPVVAMESAILIESGFSKEVDKIVMVYAPCNIRINRTIKRDSTSKEAVIQRIKAQMDDEEKKKEAHFIIVNDGVHPLIPQVGKLIEWLDF